MKRTKADLAKFKVEFGLMMLASGRTEGASKAFGECLEILEALDKTIQELGVE